MSLVPIYYIKSGSLSFADKKIFNDLDIYLYPGDRICLIGKNGSGKSSLMKVISGGYQLNTGEIFQHFTAKISYLKQENICDLSLKTYDFIIQSVESKENYYQADVFIKKLQIQPNKTLAELSGGQLRRVQLAKALAVNAQILLLDEPTNHLDIAAIEWLETYIKSYKGSIVCISHDREFLSKITNKIWWLDRGVLYKSKMGFKYFEQWQEQVIKQEEAALIKLGKKLSAETMWLHQGVTARRKRNQRRLTNLKAMREQLKSRSHRLATALQVVQPCFNGQEVKKAKFIIEAQNISFKYNENFVIKDFSISISKGDKIGIIGPNGTGKSTLVRLLVQDLEPNIGVVRCGTNLEVTYFDQHKSLLNPGDTLQQVICPSGGDQVFLQNKVMHVGAYLKSFMFDPKLLFTKVATLSGGEASRLLLAKTLIKPGNFMVLDEPTNDLDMDTIEMLLDILSDYTGTLIVVSHDRDFLDRLVTNTLVFEENGHIVNVIGGYQDYLKYYRRIDKKEKVIDLKTQKNNDEKPDQERSVQSPKKMSYKHQRLLENIPKDIDQLENRIKELEEILNDHELYNSAPEKFLAFSNEFEQLKQKIEELFKLWQEIEEIYMTK